MAIYQDREIVTIAQATRMVGVTRRTIYNWLYAGKVESIRIASGKIRIFADSLFRSPDQTRSENPVRNLRRMV